MEDPEQPFVHEVKFPAKEWKNVLVPVEWGDLSRDTFFWYINNLHCDDHFIHICHVPDFRTQISPGMTPTQVLEVMKGVNIVSEELKHTYEALLAHTRTSGKFIRVSGNNRSSALLEYCKLIEPTLIVLGSEPKPKRLSQRLSLQTLCTEQGSTESVQSRNSTHKLRDAGPCVGTVTHDLLEMCPTTAVVYRHPQRVESSSSRKSYGTDDRSSVRSNNSGRKSYVKRKSYGDSARGKSFSAASPLGSL